MKKTQKQSVNTQKLVLLALLSAIVAVLGYYGSFITIGSIATISLTLIPVVIGATLCGPLAGAWLGAVSGVAFFVNIEVASFWLNMSPHGTIITVMVKGILSGLCAGLVYKLLEKVNRYVAVVTSAVICPVVNTGLFILGSLAFYTNALTVKASGEGISVFLYIILAYVGLNFFFELGTNILLSPAIVRILDIAKKTLRK